MSSSKLSLNKMSLLNAPAEEQEKGYSVDQINNSLICTAFVGYLSLVAM